MRIAPGAVFFAGKLVQWKGETSIRRRIFRGDLVVVRLRCVRRRRPGPGPFARLRERVFLSVHHPSPFRPGEPRPSRSPGRSVASGTGDGPTRGPAAPRGCRRRRRGSGRQRLPSRPSGRGTVHLRQVVGGPGELSPRIRPRPQERELPRPVIALPRPSGSARRTFPWGVRPVPLLRPVRGERRPGERGVRGRRRLLGRRPVPAGVPDSALEAVSPISCPRRDARRIPEDVGGGVLTEGAGGGRVTAVRRGGAPLSGVARRAL